MRKVQEIQSAILADYQICFDIALSDQPCLRKFQIGSPQKNRKNA
jgi:hypothetical protein